MKSDELKSKADSEENDLKALGIYTKVLREERVERFDAFKEILLLKGYDPTEHSGQGKITIEPTPFGIVDYYPKANKILLRKSNTWITGGFNWITKNLIK